MNKHPILRADLPSPFLIYDVSTLHPSSGGGVQDKISTLSVHQIHELHPIVRLENACTHRGAIMKLRKCGIYFSERRYDKIKLAFNEIPT